MRILLVSSNIIASLTIREREIERYDKRDKKREREKKRKRKREDGDRRDVRAR